MVSLRLYSFISSAYLFFGGSAGILLSWVFFASTTPWLIDRPGNNALISGNTNITVDQWLKSLRSNLTNEDVEPIIKEMFFVHYRFSSMIFLLASFLIVFIVFLASRNRILNLMTHLMFGVWMILFGIVMKPFADNSMHARFYFVLLSLNFVGTITYLIYLRKVQTLINSEKEKQAKQTEQKKNA
jgi:hypothetical protein